MLLSEILDDGQPIDVVSILHPPPRGCREPLERALSLALPLRERTPSSTLSGNFHGRSTEERSRPDSAFGRSIYVSNLPLACNAQLLSAAIQRLLTRGTVENVCAFRPLLQVEYHEKHAFVQLSTLDAAFEVVEKRRLLQVMGFTLKVQFKKTGLMAGGASVAGGVTHANSFTAGYSASAAAGTASVMTTPLAHPFLPSLSCPAELGDSPQGTTSSSEAALEELAAHHGFNSATVEPISPASYEAFVASSSEPTLEELHKLVAAKLKQVGTFSKPSLHAPARCGARGGLDDEKPL
ncbi:proteophosphoglycan related protein [Cyclospora cayetanensis]|uniref:Proteophosphoglycan related protein n=1 Tax=Cyclospora cayetanensis TaxID=88456 RepID=A0A1D3CXI2_9EIME|nr:proteophosphoglycan related protein [Cyclospora cayetanensis]